MHVINSNYRKRSVIMIFETFSAAHSKNILPASRQTYFGNSIHVKPLALSLNSNQISLETLLLALNLSSGLICDSLSPFL